MEELGKGINRKSIRRPSASTNLDTRRLSGTKSPTKENTHAGMNLTMDVVERLLSLHVFAPTNGAGDVP